MIRSEGYDLIDREPGHDADCFWDLKKKESEDLWNRILGKDEVHQDAEQYASALKLELNAIQVDGNRVKLYGKEGVESQHDGWYSVEAARAKRAHEADSRDSTSTKRLEQSR